MSTHVFAADVGATNSRFRLSRASADGDTTTVAEARSESGDADRLKERIAAFVEELDLPEPPCAAVLGLPGRVSADRRSCAITYLDPRKAVPFDDLFGRLGVARGLLLNDLECGALGLAVQPHESLRHLCGPDEYRPGRAVLGMPGTGLGIGLFLGGGETVPAEGGNVLAALDPADPTELRIAREVAAEVRPGRTALLTYEDLLRGPAIPRIFRALGASEAAAATEDRPERVIEWAAARASARQAQARKTFHYYGRFLGRAVQTAALLVTASAVFLGGGIVIASHRLWRDSFVDAFQSHPVYRDYLRDLPVRLAVNAHVNLDGATYKAALLARGSGGRARGGGAIIAG